LAVLAASACTRHPKGGRTLVLWHTFNPEEAETLGALLGRTPLRVQAVVVPFPRAFNTFRESVASGTGCPDVFRAEQPWVPALDALGLLDRQGGRLSLPHSLDGLALLYNRALVSHPPATLEELEKTAAAATTPGHYGFFVRGDAYWFLPFLYGAGGDLLDFDRHEVYVDSPTAVAALGRYRALLAFAPPPSANDYQEQQRRFGAGEVAMILNGPWAVSELLRAPAFAEHPERLGIARLPAPPVSGHAFVVPRCAADKAAAWALAEWLSSAEAQAEWASRNGLVPSDPAVATQNPVVAAFRAALAQGRRRPAHPAAVDIFDDFTPAVQAVLRGDAEPAEALAGVARAWRRLVGPARSGTAAAKEGPR
jgi:arabinogalactan oligomer/maltooligosaccharide transport system substrate-binding protein